MKTNTSLKGIPQMLKKIHNGILINVVLFSH